MVLGYNEDDLKKCTPKMFDGVLALLDSLMIFQPGSDGWSEMIQLSLGLLLKCTHHSDPNVVAMATAKLHAVLQIRMNEEITELSFLLFTMNNSIINAIEGNKGKFHSPIALNFLFYLFFFFSFQLKTRKNIRF